VQPFQTQAAHPVWRTIGFTGQKIQRCANAKPDANRVAALGDRIGD